MALKDTIKHMRDLLHQITSDLPKSESGNKAASQRVRTGTVRLEKVAKLFRKESIKHEKSATPKKRPAAKAHSAKGHKAKTTTKSKAKSHKALARPRALALKRPTAKLPLKRASFR